MHEGFIDWPKNPVGLNYEYVLSTRWWLVPFGRWQTVTPSMIFLRALRVSSPSTTEICPLNLLQVARADKKFLAEGTRTGPTRSGTQIDSVVASTSLMRDSSKRAASQFTRLPLPGFLKTPPDSHHIKFFIVFTYSKAIVT